MPCYKHKEEDIIVVKRKRILYGLTILIVVLTIGIVLAAVPPPPANQDIGIYDTICKEFAEDDCRDCHSSGVPDRHHLLVAEGYGCLDCHAIGSVGGVISPTRDCVVCHLTSPHHDTPEAIDRECSHCHGSYVDDYNDGHYIPTYDTSLVTPATSYTAMDATTGKKWGGCEACHEPDSTAQPPIYSNPETHHNLGNLSLECDMCHGDTDADLLSIRKCEDCHGVKSLHNIQYNYDTTKGSLGFGHIGDNWDCAGCHAWYVASSDAVAPLTGPIIPSIDQVDPVRLWAGVENVVTITGDNFNGVVNGTAYTSEVVIGNDAGTTNVTPDFITATQIVVTIPQLVEGSYGLRVVKGDMASRLVSIVVVPQVMVDSSTIRKDTVIIRGSGFGDELDGSYAESLGVTVACEGNALDASIIFWDATRIVVACPLATVGDEVTVTTLHSSGSATITGSGIR